MKNFICLSIFCFIFVTLSAQNSVEFLKTDTIDIWGESTEGGECVGFYDKNSQLCRLEITYFGEMGKRIEKYYFHGDSLQTQVNINYKYDRPFYENNYKVMIDTVSFDCQKTPNKCDKSTFLKKKEMFFDKRTR
ncbi:MAG TPA: hypothetical protein PKW49_05615 [Paludibacteraceae bacterium]|nr:hypothetical protein [Paludibacteraceae bacterium]HQF49976.1 hypothetical protein [Paludibacteraceae bacterium]